LKRERDVNHLKFLYDAFLPKYYWTEVMECLRKLLLTGFVVFFYEGSGLQIFCSMIISVGFAMVYNNIKPYLMPSNNTFAIFVHSQVSFTLACTLLLRVNENLSASERRNMKIDSESLSYALLISNASVLVFGVILILRACFNTSEGDFLDVGFDEDYDEFEDKKDENQNEEELIDDLENKSDNDFENPQSQKTQISDNKEDITLSSSSKTSKEESTSEKKKKKKKKTKRRKGKIRSKNNNLDI